MRRPGSFLLVWLILVLIAGSFLSPGAVRAETQYNVDRRGLAVKGYDPVAYFVDGRPIEGLRKFELEWGGARWRFSCQTNMDAFREAPERFAPRFGGYCAYCVAEKEGLYDISPEAWCIVNGALYLNKDLEIREMWLQDIQGFIDAADAIWPELKTVH